MIARANPVHVGTLKGDSPQRLVYVDRDYLDDLKAEIKKGKQPVVDITGATIINATLAGTWRLGSGQVKDNDPPAKKAEINKLISDYLAR